MRTSSTAFLQKSLSTRLPHLDAFRFIAITLVLFFHLDIPGFQYGYLGVDLFFMLSGYLMTHTMLLDRKKNGQFRVGAFFVRRFRRIVPSLIITIFFTGLAAFILMSPEHLKDTAKQGFFAQFFLSNYLFFDQAGYFAPENSVRALLHTWSLSVEEQFYLLFALILSIGNRYSFVRVFLIVTFAGFLLLIAAYWAIFHQGTIFGLFDQAQNVEMGIFFLPPFRLLQFMAGGVIALALFNRHPATQPKWFAILGGGLIGAGIVLIYVFPAAKTMSTLLVIISFALPLGGNYYLSLLGKQAAISFLAKISYQIYLVHWPMIIFWRYWTFQPLNMFETAMLAVLSVLFGWGLFQISRKISSPVFFPKKTLIMSAVVFVLSILTQAISHFSNGADWRIATIRKLDTPASLRKIESSYCGGTDVMQGRMLGSSSDDPLVTCRHKGSGKKNIYVWGDSHARHLLPGLSEAYPDSTIQILYFTSCLAQSGFLNFRYKYEGRRALAKSCVQRNLKAFEFFKKAPSTTIIIHQYSGYEGDNSPEWFAASADLIRKLKEFGHKVVWIGSVLRPNILLTDCFNVPFVYSDDQLSQRCKGDRETVISVFKKNLILKNKFPQSFVNINSFFCSDGIVQNCSSQHEGMPLFRDKHHLTYKASIKLVQQYKNRIDFIVRE